MDFFSQILQGNIPNQINQSVAATDVQQQQEVPDRFTQTMYNSMAFQDNLEKQRPELLKKLKNQGRYICVFTIFIICFS